MLKKFWLDLTLSITLLTLLLTSGFYRGLYGLEWTDSTYTFQEALNVLNGLVPHRDTSPPVPGLSFVIEALVLKLFGANYFIHRCLGFVVSVFTFVGCFFVCRFFFKNTSDAVVISLLGATTHLGTQSFFSYTPLALAMTIWISAAVLYFQNARGRKRELIYPILIGSALACLVLVKQSIGILVSMAMFIGLGFLTLWSRVPENSINNAASTISFPRMLLGVILVFSLYFSYIGSDGVINLFELLRSSSEMKGIDQTSFLEKISSALGVVHSAKGFGVFVLFCVISYCLFELNLKAVLIGRKILFYCVVFSPLALLWADNNHGYTALLVWYLHQAVIITKLFQLSITSFLRIKRVDNHKDIVEPKKNGLHLSLFAALFTLEAGIVAHQMSWYGTSYMSFELSYIAAIVATRAFAAGSLFEFQGAFGTLSKRGAVLIALLILIYGQVASVKPRIVGTFDKHNYQTVEVEQFRDFLISKSDANAILKIKLFVKECGAQTMFQLPWAPILYTITGLENTTWFFLPYADTITSTNGVTINNELKANPPDIFIVEPYRIHENNPFPAKGMKIIYSYVDSAEFRETYGAPISVVTDEKEWLLYCRAR
jgi:hypothetical protein